MSVVREACPSCAAPLDIPPNATRIKCPYCTTSLTIQRHGNDVALILAGALTSSIEATGAATQEAIKAGSYVTQAELRRLQVAQDLSMVQMRLANVHSEIRAIERLPASPITRKQLIELRATEANLQQQANDLNNILNPPVSGPKATMQPSASRASAALRTNFAWLLFSPTGRATRSDYWKGIAVAVVVYLLVVAFAPNAPEATVGEPTASSGGIAGIFMLLFLWIGFAVSAKRYHDIGKPAWWVFVILIPVIGFFWQIYELGFLPSNPGPNQYS